MSQMRTYVISFVVIALFAFAFISFAVSFQTNWGSDAPIQNNSQIDTIYSGVNESIRNSQGSAQERNGTLYQEDPSQAGDVSSLIFGGVSAIAQTFTGIAYDIFGAIFGPVINALGLPEQATVVLGSVITTIFLISIVLLGWQLLRTGR